MYVVGLAKIGTIILPASDSPLFVAPERARVDPQLSSSPSTRGLQMLHPASIPSADLSAFIRHVCGTQRDQGSAGMDQQLLTGQNTSRPGGID